MVKNQNIISHHTTFQEHWRRNSKVSDQYPSVSETVEGEALPARLISVRCLDDALAMPWQDAASCTMCPHVCFINFSFRRTTTTSCSSSIHCSQQSLSVCVSSTSSLGASLQYCQLSFTDRVLNEPVLCHCDPRWQLAAGAIVVFVLPWGITLLCGPCLWPPCSHAHMRVAGVPCLGLSALCNQCHCWCKLK